MRKHIFVTVLVIGAVVSFACAQKELTLINVNKDGLALKGYDPVAYFTLGEPTKGSEEFEYATDGAKWRFANAEHLALFRANPKRYTPQYGGY